jgi:hypothetical protein
MGLDEALDLLLGGRFQAQLRSDVREGGDQPQGGVRIDEFDVRFTLRSLWPIRGIEPALCAASPSPPKPAQPKCVFTVRFSWRMPPPSLSLLPEVLGALEFQLFVLPD